MSISPPRTAGQRWRQPGQQQGRRFPSISSMRARSMRRALVSGFLAESIHHIHSLRARGVISSHAASAFGSEVRGFRKSGGTLCTTPAAISFFVIASPILPEMKGAVQHRAHSLSIHPDRCALLGQLGLANVAGQNVSLFVRDISFIFQPMRRCVPQSNSSAIAFGGRTSSGAGQNPISPRRIDRTTTPNFQ
jgi:hypothetical protein